MSHCHRCGEEARCMIMSMMNTQMICMDCKRKELGDPGYRAAEAKDLREYAARMTTLHGCPQAQADSVLRAADEIERGDL